MESEASRREIRATFDRIAEHFSETRHHPWPEVRAFLAGAEPVERALDIGCGNGRHSELLADLAGQTIGIDASPALLRIAERRVAGPTAVALCLGDAVGLPVRTNAIDLAVFIATIHHLPTREDRLASLAELARVLGADGRALISAWSTAHDRFADDPDRREGFDTTIEWTLPDGETVDRFYHIYAPAEFRADIEQSDLTLEAFEVSSGNCYGTVRPEGKRP